MLERVVRSMGRKIYGRELSASEIAKLVNEAVATEDTTPREAAKRSQQAKRADMLVEIEALERQGREHEAVGIVARRHARDRNDSIEVESLERYLRRWRKKRRTMSVSGAGAEVGSQHVKNSRIPEPEGS